MQVDEPVGLLAWTPMQEIQIDAMERLMSGTALIDDTTTQVCCVRQGCGSEVEQECMDDRADIRQERHVPWRQYVW